MNKVPQWPVFATSMAALSLIIAIFALARTVHAPNPASPIATPAVQDNMQPDVTEPAEDNAWVGPGIYSSDEIGLSFYVPAGYEVTTELHPRDSSTELYTGASYAINIDDTVDQSVMRILAVSSDYALGVQEGCCYFFKGTIDPSTMTLQQMVSAVSKDLQNIMYPEVVDVGGREGLRFNYTTTYVSTMVDEAVIVPLEHETYENAMLYIWLPGEHDIDVSKVELEADRSNWRDQATVQKFDEILATVEWKN